jgi:hypothetical protein
MQPLAYSANTGMWMCRNHAEIAGGINVGSHTHSLPAANGTTSAFIAGSQGLLTYPYVLNSGIFLGPVFVHQTTTTPYVIRGHIPGLWVPAHTKPLANNDTFTGTGNVSGKVFEAFHTRTTGQVMIEMSNTWS